MKFERGVKFKMEKIKKSKLYDRLNVGIIGTGMIAHSHCQRYQQMKDAKTIAVADINKNRAEEFAKKYDIPHVYKDYKKLLEREDIHAVSICLPVFLHAPVTIDALNSGKHVLCEKPMAMNGKEAEAMVKAAKRNKRKLQIYYRYRFSPEGRRAKEIIDRGELGEIYFVKIVWDRWRGRPGFDWPGFGDWFLKKEKAGGGVIMDLTGYQIDLALGLLGFPKVKSVSCNIYQEIDKAEVKRKGIDVEDFASSFIRLENDVSIYIETALAVNVDKPNETLFYGSEGGLSIFPLVFYKDFWFKKNQPTGISIKVPDNPESTGYYDPQYYFVRSILDDKPIFMCSGEEGVIITKVQEAMYRSAEAGREVKL